MIINLKLLKERVIVYPPAPKKSLNVISPSATAIKLVPCGAGISMPEWEDEAPEVGEVRLPKKELICV